MVNASESVESGGCNSEGSGLPIVPEVLHVTGLPFWSLQPVAAPVKRLPVRKLRSPAMLLFNWKDPEPVVGRRTVKVWPSPVSLLMNWRLTVSPWAIVMYWGENLSLPEL